MINCCWNQGSPKGLLFGFDSCPIHPPSVYLQEIPVLHNKQKCETKHQAKFRITAFADEASVG